jgi:hypothetical protein
MSRKDRLAGIDPLGSGESGDVSQESSLLSMREADAALFGELTRREVDSRRSGRVDFRYLSDVKQARQVPIQVRGTGRANARYRQFV